jgi:hypothetical protein
MPLDYYVLGVLGTPPTSTPHGPQLYQSDFILHDWPTCPIILYIYDDILFTAVTINQINHTY